MCLLLAYNSNAYALSITNANALSISISPEAPTQSDTILINAFQSLAFPTSGYSVESFIAIEGSQILLHILSFPPPPGSIVALLEMDLDVTVMIGPLRPGPYEVTANYFAESTSLGFTVVPEPAVGLPLGIGLTGFALLRRRQARTNKRPF